jgi:hypothetical protein
MWLLGRGATVDVLVRRVDAEVDALVAQAAASDDVGLRIREQRLPLFSALCARSRPDKARLHPKLLAQLVPVHDALCAASARLRSHLPFLAPPRAKLKPRPPRA